MGSSSRPSKKHFSPSPSPSSVGSYSSDASARSSRLSLESSRPVAQVEIVRCMRCARSVEMTSTDDVRIYGMVPVGINIYYCDRCAKMTGYK